MHTLIRSHIHTHTHTYKHIITLPFINTVTHTNIYTQYTYINTVTEKWSPREIAMFEASIAIFGKQFHRIQKYVRYQTYQYKSNQIESNRIEIIQIKMF
jgi:hypothetical protein